MAYNGPSMDDVIVSLGLEVNRFVARDTGPYEMIVSYHWPKKMNGSKFDKFITFFKYHDGSFSTALHCDAISWSHREAQLRLMAKAYDKHYTK
jgi:hypothetical protein